MSSKRIGIILLVESLIFLQLTAAWFENCDHIVNLGVNGSMYVNSPNYPKKYPSGSSCRYTITVPLDYEINIQCSMNIDKPSSGCGTEFFYISTEGNKDLAKSEYFCGSGYVQRKSLFRTMTIAYTSSSTTAGGAFSCLVQSNPQPCDCGWSVNTKIVGGVEAKINEFPLMAGIVDMPLNKVICGAAIISHRYCVSAAHCVANRDPTKLAIVVGEHDLKTGAESPYTKIHLVYSIRTHENYNPSTNYNDIALVATVTNIEWSRGVAPACLPFLYSFAQFNGENVDIAGWGTTSFGGQTSTVLMKATTVVATNANCQRAVPNLIASQMCTYSPPKDSCQFDSGGPVIKTFSRQFCIALISYGTACGGSTPGINTRMTSHLDWITRNTGEQFCRKS